jgi:hypothetical protein
VVAQACFQRLAEIVHEMKAAHDLHGVGGATANALGIQVAPITTDDGDRRMFGDPSRDRRRRAIGPQVHDAVIREIDQDRAVAMTPPLGPLVDADGLQGRRVSYRGHPYQPEQGGRAGRQP